VNGVGLPGAKGCRESLPGGMLIGVTRMVFFLAVVALLGLWAAIMRRQ